MRNSKIALAALAGMAAFASAAVATVRPQDEPTTWPQVGGDPELMKRRRSGRGMTNASFRRAAVKKRNVKRFHGRA